MNSRFYDRCEFPYITCGIWGWKDVREWEPFFRGLPGSYLGRGLLASLGWPLIYVDESWPWLRETGLTSTIPWSLIWMTITLLDLEGGDIRSLSKSRRQWIIFCRKVIKTTKKEVWKDTSPYFLSVSSEKIFSLWPQRTFVKVSLGIKKVKKPLSSLISRREV